MTDDGRRSPLRRVPLVLALVAVLAAAVAALGPAGDAKTTFSWPPTTLPDESPQSVWFTPLLLVREQADRIEARIPCDLPDALPDAERPVTVLATARDPVTRGALGVLEDGDELVVRVGGTELARVATARASEVLGGCSYVLRVDDSRWSLEGGREGVALAGELEAMPYVSALFSGVDLRAEPSPSIQLTTEAHGSRPTVVQKLGWIVATLSAVAALLIAGLGGARLRRPRLAAPLRRAVRHVGLADAVVAAVLLVWWVIGPAYFDDGWVVARQSMFESSGGFSNYYDSFAGNHPLGYWLEWLQHWLVESTRALVVLRIPALLCLAVTWVLCRWILARALATSSIAHGGIALWAMASAFLVWSMSWGMTLRPEPQVAVLVTGVLACCVLFLERQTAGPLAVATVLVVLGFTAHPAAIVTLAPVVVIAPTLWRWARPRLATAAAIVAAGAALGAVLLTIGADLQRRAAEAQAIRTSGNAIASWREEIVRYSSLNAGGFGTPLRRESVALMALAVIAFVLRSRRDKRPVLDLPGAALPVALVLLIPTPAKWSWHFGALIGLVAVAVACETARFREQGDGSRGWSARALIAVGAAVLAGAWAPGIRPSWNELDLMTQNWTLRLEEGFLTLPKIAALAPVVLLVGGALYEIVRRGRGRLYEVPWRVASWTALALAAPLIAYTVAVLVGDYVRTPSWTLTRQNLESLRGDDRCGLAGDAVVAANATMRPLPTLRPASVREVPPWVARAPLDGLTRHFLGIADGRTIAETPWFDARGRRPIGVFIFGLAGPPSSLDLEWGRIENGRVESLGVAQVESLLIPEERIDFVPWRFFPAKELPPRPAGADAVRLALRTSVPTNQTITVTAPVEYANQTLRDRIEQPAARTVVQPHLYPYVPCAQQPELRDGVLETPNQIIGQRSTFFPTLNRPGTPFTGVLDVYRLQRLPLSDSERPPRDVIVYDVDESLPGGVLARPDRTKAT